MTDSVVLYALTILTEAFTNSCDGNDDDDDDDRGGDGDMAMIIRTAETMKTMMAMINILDNNNEWSQERSHQAHSNDCRLIIYVIIYVLLLLLVDISIEFRNRMLITIGISQYHIISNFIFSS